MNCIAGAAALLHLGQLLPPAPGDGGGGGGCVQLTWARAARDGVYGVCGMLYAVLDAAAASPPSLCAVPTGADGELAGWRYELAG
jgi:hypothetical protein